MKKCNSKIKHTCGSTNYSTCIHWEGDVNPQSELVDENCLDQQVVDQDQYNQLEEIWNQVDLSELGENCLEYLTDENDKIIVKNVLLKFEEKICELEEKINTLETTAVCDLSISSCNIDWGTLADQCGEQPQTLAQAIQLLANQHNT
jgi:hypothetical protein